MMAAAQSRQITVQVVDGIKGVPLIDQHLTVFVGETPDAVVQLKKKLQLLTNKDGMVSLVAPSAANWIQIWPDLKVLCQPDPKTKSFSVADIVSTGVATPNTCSSLVRKAEPGQFVVFARTATLTEKLRR